ncbi:hypothetical protein BC936DRAFT_148526 [Jimgerdemannia flammicorona]|uniref:Uncharacterized protein n=1 Tax=Jimgerdemannia flammicorona TaxID=994334 RepID=A0A433DKE1_9FUNG|nr:hypothetical protein BC936DRAFT_148526 [Jimgerdemannia flammicorona]
MGAWSSWSYMYLQMVVHKDQAQVFARFRGLEKLVVSCVTELSPTIKWRQDRRSFDVRGLLAAGARILKENFPALKEVEVRWQEMDGVRKVGAAKI